MIARLLIINAILCAIGFAQTTSTTPAPVPATSPTTTAVSMTPKLVILRFAQLDDHAGTAWIGRAVQQSLLAEAARLPVVAPSAPGDASKPAPSITDPEQAVAFAKTAGARFIVIGGYQSVDAELRLTGQVIDVDAGQIIGGLKATGTPRDLFGMQDTLASQMRRILATKISAGTQPSSQGNWWEAPTVRVAAMRVPRGWSGSDVERSLRREPSPMLRDEYDRYRFTDPTYFYGRYGVGYGYRSSIGFSRFGGFGFGSRASISANYITGSNAHY